MQLLKKSKNIKEDLNKYVKDYLNSFLDIPEKNENKKSF